LTDHGRANAIHSLLGFHATSPLGGGSFCVLLCLVPLNAAAAATIALSYELIVAAGHGHNAKAVIDHLSVVYLRHILPDDFLCDWHCPLFGTAAGDNFDRLRFSIAQSEQFYLKWPQIM
jgi:hypothetical protein